MGKIIRNGVEYGGSIASSIKLTQAEFNALSPEEQNNGLYIITDGYSEGSASNMAFDNTSSGLSATSVEDAINEIKNSIDETNSNLSDVQSDLATVDNKLTVTTGYVVVFDRTSANRFQIILQLPSGVEEGSMRIDFNEGTAKFQRLTSSGWLDIKTW